MISSDQGLSPNNNSDNTGLYNNDDIAMTHYQAPMPYTQREFRASHDLQMQPLEVTIARPDS